MTGKYGGLAMMGSRRRQRTYDVIVTREVLGIRQKPKKRRRTFPRVRLLSVPVLIGVAAILSYLLMAPAYRVHGASVRGNTLIEAQAIYQMSMVDGQNLFLLNTRAAAQAIERLPYVKRASVRARLPAQVSIVVEEYQPRWVWVAGESRFWIDETGNILPYNGPLEGSLTVVDPSGRPLPVGATLDSHVVVMLDALSRLLPDEEEVTYDENMGFVLTVGPGWPVRIGKSPDDLAAKLGILNALLPQLVAQNLDIAFIDLRYPEQPYFRLK